MRPKRFVFAAIVAIAATMGASVPAAAGPPLTFTWEGQTWDLENAMAVENADGTATLTRTVAGTAQLHVNRLLPAPGGESFVNANGTPWVEFAYVDDGTSQQGFDLFVDDEVTTDNPRLQGGSLFDCDGIGFARFAAEEEVAFSLNCGPPDRAAGPHTLYVGQRADGTLDFRFDGVWYTSTFLRDNVGFFDFNDIFLRWRGGDVDDTATFTSFEYGDNHTAPAADIVPAPSPEPAPSPTDVPPAAPVVGRATFTG